MYYLHNLYDGTVRTFLTKCLLAQAWLCLFHGRCFQMLNLTGNDTFAYRSITGWRDIQNEDGTADQVPIYKTIYALREYMVTDKNGRILDIRLWEPSVWENTPARRAFGSAYHSGAKSHRRRASGPFGHHRTLQQMADDSFLEETEDYEILGQSMKPRNKTVIRGAIDYSYYEKWHARSYYVPRCWKDQSKARHQYNRHHKGGTKLPSYEPEPGDELAARLSEELCRNAASHSEK